jgi:hypothetical protein
MSKGSIRLPNGEREWVVRRYKIAGKNMGFLCIGCTGNCYWTFRHVARFVFDLTEHPAANKGGRAGVMKLFAERRKQLEDEAFCSAVASRMINLRKGDK